MNWSTVIKRQHSNASIESPSSHTSSRASSSNTNLKSSSNSRTSSTSSYRNYQKESQEDEAARHSGEQRRISNEVLVTGFTAKPAESYWEELIKAAEMDTNEVVEHTVFSHNKRFFIIIGFMSQKAQENFIKATNFKNTRKTTPATRIYAHKRLTKFNSSVEKELRQLKKSTAISDFKFEGFLFKAQLTDSSPWILIDTQQNFQKFITSANLYQKEIESSERLTNLKEQQALDRKIILQGFPYIPTKIDDVIARFMRHFGLSFDHVTGYRFVRSKNSEQILIQLSEKSIQMKILAPNERKIQLKKLMPGNTSNVDITWDRALTEFNEFVSQKLTKAFKYGKIEKFEFVGYRFYVQVDQQLPWMAVECYSDLDDVFKPRIHKVESVEGLNTSMSAISINSSGYWTH